MKAAIFFLSFLLLNCASNSGNIEKKVDPEVTQSNLTQAQAESRFLQIKDVSYFLEISLSATEKNYSGKSTLHFKVNHLDHPVRIDFYQGKIISVTANGKDIPTNYNGKYLLIPTDTLTLGDNQVAIEFSTNYNLEGRGLSKFQDPEDKSVYIHTQLEPFNANYVFPCFDQPDLKATYEMNVKAPQAWIVVSSNKESSIKEDGDFRVWHFPRSEKFSTYVWSLHAGPFKVWEKNFRIPLRLMARQSLAKYVKTEEWFQVTQQGLDFYEKYFATSYPFKKYDQLIVPEFTSGAMENVAAVTFNEGYVSRGDKSLREKRALANVILHEMAHMWFGDLVTMKWWNDLWLNESFATYMADLAMTSNTVFKDAWRDFYSGKTGAYWEDEMVTTHPVATDVADTLHAMANFDNITYGKGAAVLKQTSFYLTSEKFQKGVQLYFTKYAGTNTTLDDFMGALSEGSGKNLTEWKKIWLRTAGVNKLESQLTCAQGLIQSLTLTQTPPAENPYLRTQRLQVVLLNSKQEELKTGKVFPIEISKAVTDVTEAKGQPCPSLVYPNFEDHGYLSAILDPVSLKNFSENPQGLKDAFLRQMVWRSLWDLTREAKLPVLDYIKVAIKKGIAVETDDYILKDLYRSVAGRDSLGASALFYLSRSDQKLFEAQAKGLEELTWQRLNKASAGSEQQKTFFEGFLMASRTDFSQEKLFQLVQGKIKLSGFSIDQDKRWAMINILARSHHPQAKLLISKEAKKDVSFFGQAGMIGSTTALPFWLEKKKWIEEFKSEKPQHSMALIKSALYNIFPFNQEKLREDYSNEFFKDLIFVNKTKDASVAASFVGLAPIDCGYGKSDRIGPFLQEQKDLQPTILKRLKIQKQENERCQKIIQPLG